MTKTLQKQGKTVDEAVEKALAELGKDRDEVSVEIIERGKTGFLGIGAVPAVVAVSYEAPDERPAPKPAAPKQEKPAPAPKEQKTGSARKQKKPAEKPTAAKKEERMPAEQPAPVKKGKRPEGEQAEETEKFLSGLLERMGVEAEIEIAPRKGGGLNVNLTGSGIGAVIGRRGETLDAIQHLTNYVVNRGSDKHAHINVDAENYRAKREESLVHLAEKMAQKAIKYKRSMALEPMNSYERHVIHAALQNYEGVTTSSTGTEPNRRVVVSYVPQETKKSNDSYKEWC